MVFYIVDHGRRIERPYQDLFKPSALKEVQATNPIQPVSNQQTTQPKATNKSAIESYQNSNSKENKAKLIKQAKDIMTSPVISLSLISTIDQAWDLFQKHGFRHIPVLSSEQKVMGIVSDRDMIRTSALVRQREGRQETETALSSASAIKEIMSHQVISASEDTMIREIADLMFRHKLGSVPIVDTENRLKGIITRSDILHAIVNEGPLELWI